MAIVVVTDHPFENLDTERRILAQAGHALRFDGNVTSTEDVRSRVAGAEAVLNCYSPMPAEVFDGLEGCTIVARYGIGIDTIDIPAATARGILVTNVPDYCIDEVSDHALALMLSLSRGVVRLDRNTRSGSWSATDGPTIHRLRGRTLGLVGFGRIARALASKAHAIGFVIVAYDPFVDDAAVTEAGAEPVTLDELLARADVISIHAPLTDATRHLIGEQQLARMQPGAILVNTSRGGLIDTAALRAAVESGALGGVGLDVLETEPPDPDDPLLRHPAVVITPHVAYSSRESVAELQRKAAEQVVIALDGGVPPYAVNARELGR